MAAKGRFGSLTAPCGATAAAALRRMGHAAAPKHALASLVPRAAASARRRSFLRIERGRGCARVLRVRQEPGRGGFGTSR